MRQVRCLVTFLWICVSGTAYAQSPSSHADEIAIRGLIQRYVDARNSRDAEKTRSLFTTDADQLVSTGEWRKGIDAVVQGAMASSQKEAAKSSIEVEAVRLLGSEIALVDGRYETVISATGASRRMWTTLIVKRTGHGWRIAAIRNMLPTPAAASTSQGRDK